MSTRSLAVTALQRGLRKRCPHCGIGRQFAGWIEPLDRCPHCGLVFEPNQGDTWFFAIIGDRLPVAAVIVGVYFNFLAVSLWLGTLTFVVALVFLIWTTPNRWAVGVALHYISRTIWPDASDPMPPVPK
jgi:uncharacterized protein (DUF983 family)